MMSEAILEILSFSSELIPIQHNSIAHSTLTVYLLCPHPLPSPPLPPNTHPQPADI